MAKQLKITLKKSIIGRNQRQRKTIEALGLKKIGQTVVHDDTPQIRGMIDRLCSRRADILPGSGTWTNCRASYIVVLIKEGL